MNPKDLRSEGTDFKLKDMKIKHISQFPYGSNTAEGLLFLNGIRLTEEQRSQVLKLNKFVGNYWRNKTCLSNIRHLYPGKTVAEIRQGLWDKVNNSNELDPPAYDSNVTLWYYSRFDREVCELIVKYSSWYLNNITTKRTQ